MAKHSLYIGELKKALSYLNESIQVSTNNATQKAHSYLRMGELYYDSLRDFKTASYYYDSTMSLLPASSRGYEKISERREHLQELAQHLELIESQDKLLALSQFSGAALDSALALEIAKDKEKAIQKKEAEQINAQKKDRQIVESQALVQETENTWYFYNPNAVIQGNSAFLRAWGNRPLEDNWRRSRRVMLGNVGADNEVVFAEDNGLPQEEDIFANVKSLEDRKSEIPSTPEAQAEAKAKIEDAVFQAGKILLFKLKEGKESIQMLGRMPKDYPQGEKTPEAIYLMYQYCLESKTCDTTPYKDLLISQYAETFYGKLLINPNHIKELNTDEKKVEAMYKLAFDSYKFNNYKKANDLVDELITLHPENNIMDKVKFLQVLIIGKTTKHIAEYYAGLNKFVQDYPKSELVKNAEQLLKQISQEELERGSIEGRN
jgi:tetratricopeptide (TPR) repeat protein